MKHANLARRSKTSRLSIFSVVCALAAAVAAGAILQAQTQTPTPTPSPTDPPPPPPSAPFFDDSIVQSVSLTINSRDWQSLRDNYLDNTYYPCDFKWTTQTVRNIGIRSRGTGSRNPTKPGLRVDFDRYKGGQTFLGLKSFILRNQTQDPSNMHERISFLLFRKLGVKTPREAFTKLFVNNKYWGLYSIVESVDKTFLDASFGDNDGHLYKYDYNVDDQPWYFEDKGSDPNAYVPHPFKPETKEDDPEPEKVMELVRIVNNDSDAAWRLNVEPYINWDNFLKHIAIENVIADQDGFNGDYGINNFYFYRLHNQKTFMWIPWDKSEAFKNTSQQPIWHNILDGTPAKRNRISGRAMTSPDLQTKYLNFLVDAAKALGEVLPLPTDGDKASGSDTSIDTRGWMEREIEREYAQIKDLVYIDTERPFTNEDFEKDVEKLRTFARERTTFVLKAVDDWRKSR